MLAAALLAAVLLTDLPIDRIVLLSGHQIPVSGEVLTENDRVIFRNVAGVLYSIHVDEVDMPATLASGAPPAAVADRVVDDPRRRVRKLTVSDEEKELLLRRLSTSRGEPAAPPAAGGMTDEEVAEELERSEQDQAAKREDEAYWRAEASEARERLANLRDEVAALQERERRLEDELRFMISAGYPPDALAGHSLQLDRSRSRLEDARRGLASAERAWNDLQNRARQAGAMPGWLR